MKALLLIASLAQPPAPATSSTHRALAERFVAAVRSGSPPRADHDANELKGLLAEALARANPGREADARRVGAAMAECMARGQDTAMRQAAVEAALALSDQQLQRLIAFVDMRDAQRRNHSSNRVSAEWEPARQDYGRWMYSIPTQPASVALVQRCTSDMEADIAGAGLRGN